LIGTSFLHRFCNILFYFSGFVKEKIPPIGSSGSTSRERGAMRSAAGSERGLAGIASLRTVVWDAEGAIMISFMRSASSVESLGTTLLMSFRLLLVLSLALGVTRLYHRISRLAGVWLGEDRY
jgi:hypothetical protein